MHSPEFTTGGISPPSRGDLSRAETGRFPEPTSANTSGKVPTIAGQDLLSTGSTRAPRAFVPRAALVGHIDHAALDSLLALLDDATDDDPIRAVNLAAALRGGLSDLWLLVGKASRCHQSILTIMEKAALQSLELNRDLVRAYREAIRDLKETHLTDSHVEAVRRLFIELGSNPMLGCIAEEPESESTQQTI